jgi:hypothetical protein
MATISILANPTRYPEFTATGLWKTNSALFGFAAIAGHVMSIKAIAKVFTALVLLAQSFTLPHFVYYFRGRAGLKSAVWFFPPLVHHWFVSMGMLNYSLSIPLTLLLVMALAEHRRRGGPIVSCIALSAYTVLIWYCHAFSLCILIALVGGHLLMASTVKKALHEARIVLLPLVPVGLLIVTTLVNHSLHKVPDIGESEPFAYTTLPWLIYDIWAHCLYGFTEATITSLGLGVMLVVFACMRLRNRRDSAPFLFSRIGLAVLALFYLALPETAMNWSFFGARFLPYFWIGLLLWTPLALTRRTHGILAILSCAYVVGMNSDLVRVGRDHTEFASGVDAVPDGARLLPLNFNSRLTSKNTWSTDTASGLYVVARHTSAQDIWANNRSMPIVHTVPPPDAFDRLKVRRFITHNGSPSATCASERELGQSAPGCEERFLAGWSLFWTAARARYSHILLWRPSSEVRATLPASMTVLYETPHLLIMATNTEALK